MKTINVATLDSDAKIPTRTYQTDAGMDLYALIDVPYQPDDVILVHTGIAVEVPHGYVGLVRDRSSVGKSGLKVTAGVVDPGYTGDVSVVLLNLSGQHGCIKAGQKIAQMLIIPVATPEIVEVTSLQAAANERGNKGFGSSGAW